MALIENEDEFNDLGKELQSVDSASVKDFLSQRFAFNPKLGMWVIVSYSDYSGTIADHSNARYLLKTYPGIVTERVDQEFSTVYVGVPISNIENLSTEILSGLDKDLETIENKSVIDPEDCNLLRQERENYVWLQWVKPEFVSELTACFQENAQAIAALGETDKISGLFEEARQASGMEWTEKPGGDMDIDGKSVANSVTAQMLQRWLNLVQQPPVGESLMEAREFSCLMAPAPAEVKDAVIRFGQMFITNDELYEDPEDPGGFGRESEVHVTVKFGLHEAQPSEELLRIIEETQPFEIEIGPVTLFENEKFDVVKFDVDGAGLREMNRRVSELPNGDSYPDYHPHMTVAYVTKGTCNELIGKPLFDPGTVDHPRFLVKSVVFSSKDKTKKTLFLGKPNNPEQPVQESEESDLDDTDSLKDVQHTDAKPVGVYKQFTDNDVDDSGTFPTIYADRSELVVDRNPPLVRSATGYGARLPLGMRIYFNGKPYRLYSTCYGNSGSVWFIAKGRKIFVH